MSGNCPFCPKDNPYESWGFSPEGWEEARRNHEQNHTCKCCGQTAPSLERSPMPKPIVKLTKKQLKQTEKEMEKEFGDIFLKTKPTAQVKWEANSGNAKYTCAEEKLNVEYKPVTNPPAKIEKLELGEEHLRNELIKRGVDIEDEFEINASVMGILARKINEIVEVLNAKNE